MSDIFEKFVVESTKLHREALSEQSKISEDINRQSLWFLGLTSAAVGLLVTQLRAIATYTWFNSISVSPDTALMVVGLILVAATFFGAWHQHLSIQERNCYKVQHVLFGAQSLIPFFKHPDYPTDCVPENMHVRISEGELLNHDKVDLFKKCIASGNKNRLWAERTFSIQKILAAVGYFSLFVLALPNA
jgi:hypothetical protein